MSCVGNTMKLVLMMFVLIGGGVASSIDYWSALTKSLLYYEAQRSGKLPPTQRVQWRADSALHDGSDNGMDLVGGYYDAGDNVKFGFTMAFTMTMLSWSAVDFRDELSSKKELSNALGAIRWGTDYLMKAHPSPDVLYGQVGDGDADHACWQRPEDMTSTRPSYKIDAQNPGSDLAAETAAALAAASIAFSPTDWKYSQLLVTHARQLFDFASNYLGTYQSSISKAGEFYSSSGYQDELLWAAAWLYRATNDQKYLNYLSSAGSGGPRTAFSWDDKYLGAQVLVAKLVLEGKLDGGDVWGQYKSNAEQFICNCLQKGNSNFKKSPGGLLWFMEWDNLQYTSTATFISTVYSKYLYPRHASIQCPAGLAYPSDLDALARSQLDYILGSNPSSMSYMVGFGSNYPTHAHHRGASIVSVKKDPVPVTCQGGFDKWFNGNGPNPNVIDGAVVGGPDANDYYSDSRSNYKSGEPTIATVAPLVGPLAYFA